MALAFDLAAEVCLTRNGQPPVATILTNLLKGFSGEPGEQQEQEEQGYYDDGPPVYVDGEYRGGGERIKMSAEEFIKRTVAPPDPNWFGGKTRGTPRILNYNDPDVV